MSEQDPARRESGAGVPAPSPATGATPLSTGPAELSGTSSPPSRVPAPSFVFFGILSALSLLADVLSKAWAEIALTERALTGSPIVLIEDHLALALAYNPGGAWGLLQNADETIRRPFFFMVSVVAIAFIVSLYGRLGRSQWALRWGLPLVLGGALGNLSDRITRNSVIDFIDYRAEWVRRINELVASGVNSWGVTDHWPTFNVADISICIGVGLMAVDMVTSRRGAKRSVRPKAVPFAPADHQNKLVSKVPDGTTRSADDDVVVEQGSNTESRESSSSVS